MKGKCAAGLVAYGCVGHFFFPPLERRGGHTLKMYRGESEECAHFERNLQEQGKDGYLQPNWV